MPVQLQVLVISVFIPDILHMLNRLNSVDWPAQVLRYDILLVYAVSATFTVLTRTRSNLSLGCCSYF
jgi:hypothetical protein